MARYATAVCMWPCGLRLTRRLPGTALVHAHTAISVWPLPLPTRPRLTWTPAPAPPSPPSPPSCLASHGDHIHHLPRPHALHCARHPAVLGLRDNHLDTALPACYHWYGARLCQSCNVSCGGGGSCLGFVVLSLVHPSPASSWLARSLV